MLDNLIEQIQAAVQPFQVELGGRDYLSRQVVLPPPEPQYLGETVNTLTGLVDYIRENPDGIELREGYSLVIFSPTTVCLVGPLKWGDRHKKRDCYLTADCKEVLNKPFKPEVWLPNDLMTIELMTKFADNQDRQQLIHQIGNLVCDEVRTYADDGVTQQVTTKTGVATVERTPGPLLVRLMPFRTFAEVQQPASNYLVRVRKGKEQAEVALFDAGHVDWKLDAISSIKTFLANFDLGIPIIG